MGKNKFISVNLLRIAIDQLEKNSLVDIRKNSMRPFICKNDFYGKINKSKQKTFTRDDILKILNECSVFYMSTLYANDIPENQYAEAKEKTDGEIQSETRTLD